MFFRVLPPWLVPKSHSRVAKTSCKLSFRSAALSRAESAVSPLADSRFLADRHGFGMTRGRVVSAQTALNRELLSIGLRPESLLKSLYRSNRFTPRVGL